MAAYRWVGNGCPPKERLALCKIFIAKAVGTLYTHRQHPYRRRLPLAIPMVQSAHRIVKSGIARNCLEHKRLQVVTL